MYFNLIRPYAGREREATHQVMEASVYREHQWLWQFFSAPENTPRPFLFHRAGSGADTRFYVLSSSLPESPFSAWQVQSKKYDPHLEKGLCLRFELRANPVVTRKASEGRSKRHDVVMQEKRNLLAARGLSSWREWKTGDRPTLYQLVQQTCSKWLQDRAEGLGFTVDMGSLQVDAYQSQKTEKLQFSSVDFKGVLRVSDPKIFEETLLKGIGPAKAFGCGLLLIRPE